MKNKIPGKLLLIFLLHSFMGLSQSSPSPIVQLKNPACVSTPKGYSQVAVIDLPNCQMLLFSGQVPLDKEGNLVGKDDMGKQAEQVFLNIKNSITELGGNITDLVKITYYIRDVSKIQAVRDARDKFINLQKLPASTLVEVTKLYREDVLIEIEATAVIPKKM